MTTRKGGYVYILTNKPLGTLYIGVTAELENRLSHHKRRTIAGFSKRYNLDKLVHYEICGTIEEAIAREKQLKRWHRQWKINLIEANNPEWRDLSEGWTGEEVLPSNCVPPLLRDPKTSSG